MAIRGSVDWADGRGFQALPGTGFVHEGKSVTG
jgi:hypothetical protein